MHTLYEGLTRRLDEMDEREGGIHAISLPYSLWVGTYMPLSDTPIIAVLVDDAVFSLYFCFLFFMLQLAYLFIIWIV